MNEQKMTQAEMIVNYIEKFGSITSLEAMRDLGCYRLASRISDLKKRGFVFESKMVEVANRFGGKSRVKRYKLANAPDNGEVSS